MILPIFLKTISQLFSFPFAISVVCLVFNNVAGHLATCPFSPFRRVAGWFLLFVYSFALASIRLAFDEGKHVSVAILIFILPLLLGYSTGNLIHKITPILAEYRKLKKIESVII